MLVVLCGAKQVLSRSASCVRWGTEEPIQALKREIDLLSCLSTFRAPKVAYQV